jgi:hypothetical protein
MYQSQCIKWLANVKLLFGVAFILPKSVTSFVLVCLSHKDTMGLPKSETEVEIFRDRKLLLGTITAQSEFHTSYHLENNRQKSCSRSRFCERISLAGNNNRQVRGQVIKLSESHISNLKVVQKKTVSLLPE